MNAASSIPFILSATDLTALVVILLDGYFGFRRGLSGEVARFVVLILGVVATALLLHPVGSLCFRYVNPLIPEPVRYVFAFVATTIAASLIMLFVYRPIYNWFDRDAPKHRNKFGGLVSGLIRGFIVVMFVLIVVNLWPSTEATRAVAGTSLAGKTADKIVPAVKRRLSSQRWTPSESGNDDKGFLKMLREEKRDHSAISE